MDHAQDRHRLPVSLFPSVRARRPRSTVLPLDGLASMLAAAWPAREKMCIPLWSPAIYPRGATRSAARVQALSAVVLDYDEGLPPDDEEEGIRAALEPWVPWRCLWHTSWSHMVQDDRHAVRCARLRVVLPLAEPVDVALWPRIWARAAARSGGLVDQACKDPSRIWFLPAARPGGLYRCGGHEGPLLRIDPDRLPPLPTPLRPRVSTPISLSAGRGADRLLRARLGADPVLRARVCAELGGQDTGSEARGIACPQCRRRSVWYPLAPSTTGGRWARCDHRNSCGWWGGLDMLWTGAADA